jgi:hypothetical protein
MWRDIDVLLVPTAPTHYTREQPCSADPVVLNRNLGAYTNFVNLLDYAALSVPSSLRRRPAVRHHADRPVRQRLAAGRTRPALPPRHRPAARRDRRAAARAAPIAGLAPAPPTVKVAVVGAHLSGMPLNGQLTERGATLLRHDTTAPDYRLYACPAPRRPSPACSAWRPAKARPSRWRSGRCRCALRQLRRADPAPLGIGTLELADGSSVQGFICEGARAGRRAGHHPPRRLARLRREPRAAPPEPHLHSNSHRFHHHLRSLHEHLQDRPSAARRPPQLLQGRCRRPGRAGRARHRAGAGRAQDPHRLLARGRRPAVLRGGRQGLLQGSRPRRGAAQVRRRAAGDGRHARGPLPTAAPTAPARPTSPSARSRSRASSRSSAPTRATPSSCSTSSSSPRTAPSRPWPTWGKKRRLGPRHPERDAVQDHAGARRRHRRDGE